MVDWGKAFSTTSFKMLQGKEAVKDLYEVTMEDIKKYDEKNLSFCITQQITIAILERVICLLACLPYTKWRLVWHWKEKNHLHLDKWSSEHHIQETVYALGLSWANWSSYLFGQLPEEMQLCCNMRCSWKEKYAMNGQSHLHVF